MVDIHTNYIFEQFVERIVELKKDGQPTLQLENEIDTKLAEIYSLSTEEMGIISSSESAKVKGIPATKDLSELVSS